MAVIRISDFNLPTVYVDDFEKALAFYTGVLGFTKARDMTPGVLLQITPDLVMYLEGGRQPVAASETGACTCMCFSTEEGITESYRRLQEAGVRMIGEYLEFGPELHMFRIADPAGNVIEFAGKP